MRTPSCSCLLATLALAVAGCHADPDADAGATATATAPPSTDSSAPAATGNPPADQASAPPDTAAPGGFKPLVDPNGRITQGRCHMDACSWTKWETLEVVGNSDDELELKASVRSGISEHARKDDALPDYPETADGVAIQWDAPVTVLYRCSKTRPSLQWGDEPRVTLTLNPDSFIPGAMESAARGYFAACHSDFSAGPGDAAVVKYGYRVPIRE